MKYTCTYTYTHLHFHPCLRLTGMATPAVYKRVRSLPGCDRGTLRYAMRHTHCNRVAATAPSALGEHEAVGYLIGGAGVRGDFMGCNTFGFGYYETTARGGEVMVGFNLANETHDTFDAALECFLLNGVGKCLHFGEVWRNTTQT